MTAQHRMQWYDAKLIDQIVAGAKTATVRPLAWSEGLDAFNTALHVGAVYTVYDRDERPRCQLRVTAVELCRWDAIPEALWQRDPATSGEVSLEAFRSDHHEFFGDPDADYEFLAVYFDRIDDPA